MPRFISASLPLASNVAKVGSSPVRMLELAALPAVVFSFVKLQNTFTFPEKENAQPFDICIVRPCALAVAVTPSARPNNSNVRRFIREPLLREVACSSGFSLRLWMTDLIRKGAEPTSSSRATPAPADLILARRSGRQGRRPRCPGGPKGKPTFWAPLAQNPAKYW